MVNKKILVAAVVLALITSFLIFIYIKGIEKANDSLEYISVVIAKKDIDAKSVITNEDIEVVEMIKSYVNHKAFTNMNDVVGNRAKDKIIQGEQILRDRIVDKDKTTLSYVIPEGKRAVTVNVNEAVMVADFIRPGDYVDILVTFDKYEIESSTSKTIYPRTTKMALQNLLVLGMGQLQNVPDVPRSELPRTVTLAVTPEQAEKLVFCEETAVIKMALRHVGDDRIVSTPGVIREDMVTERGKIVLPK